MPGRVVASGDRASPAQNALKRVKRAVELRSPGAFRSRREGRIARTPDHAKTELNHRERRESLRTLGIHIGWQRAQLRARTLDVCDHQASSGPLAGHELARSVKRAEVAFDGTPEVRGQREPARDGCGDFLVAELQPVDNSSFLSLEQVHRAVAMSLHTADGAALKLARDSRRMSRERLGARAGVCSATIRRIERGEVTPRASTLERIVRALDEARKEAGA